MNCHARGSLACCAGLLVLGMVTSVCSSSTPAPASAPAATSPSPQTTAVWAEKGALWGEMKPIVSVKELMRDMLDPASDFIFDAVSIVDGKNGSVEKIPKTEEDWARVRIGAVTLAEGAYLLKVPRPFAPPGDENNSTGPDAEELSPAQILAKLEKDPVEWNARIEALRNVGLEVLDIVKKKDAKELWDASDNLDEACENCHVSYWYPNEGALFKKLDRRLLDLYGPSSRGNKAAPAAKPKGR